MAERVAEFPRIARVRRYPWHEWMDGSVWKLEHGVDFTGSFKNMRATIITHAKRNNVAVKTSSERDLSVDEMPERWLYVRFYPGRPFGWREGEDPG